MNRLEKLGITPGPWECRCGWWIGKNKKCIATCDDNISSLITAAPEMFESLVEIMEASEVLSILDNRHHIINTINQIKERKIFAGKTWEEIKGML